MNSHRNGESGNQIEKANHDNYVVRASGLTKIFKSTDGQLDVLRGLDLNVKHGEMVSIVGESGAGKSTLLHILGGLDTRTDGNLEVCGVDYSDMDDDALAKFRNDKIGFVFQFHHLMSDFSALENVMMPMLISGKDQTESRNKASYLLERMGLEDRLKHRPGKLSGGEQQRVAVARALATDPQVVLADEPSGNLDTKTASSLHQTLLDLNDNMGITFIIATHNRDFARDADNVYELTGGVAVARNTGELS